MQRSCRNHVVPGSIKVVRDVLSRSLVRGEGNPLHAVVFRSFEFVLELTLTLYKRGPERVDIRLQTRLHWHQRVGILQEALLLLDLCFEGFAFLWRLVDAFAEAIAMGDQSHGSFSSQRWSDRIDHIEVGTSKATCEKWSWILDYLAPFARALRSGGIDELDVYSQWVFLRERKTQESCDTIMVRGDQNLKLNDKAQVSSAVNRLPPCLRTGSGASAKLEPDRIRLVWLCELPCRSRDAKQALSSCKDCVSIEAEMAMKRIVDGWGCQSVGAE